MKYMPNRRVIPAAGMLILLCCGVLGCGADGQSAGTAIKPEDDAYSILLLPLSGSDHIEAAEFHRKRAEKYTGWSGLYVVNKENYSGLYWGKYRTRQDAAKKLRTAKQWQTPATKQRIFQKAIVVRQQGKDIGPPEWNLKNVKEGYYTVLIGVFFDIPEKNYSGRKRRAVEVCKKMRQQGRETYYHHGPSKSIVTIGTFPRNALKTVITRARHPQTGDISQIESKTPVDAGMKSLLKEFEDLTVCGNYEATRVYNPKKRTMELVRRKSAPMVIPGRKSTAGPPPAGEPYKPHTPPAEGTTRGQTPDRRNP